MVRSILPLTHAKDNGECMRLRIVCLCVIVITAMCLSSAQDMNLEAQRIQANVLGIASHNDTVQRVMYENADLGKRTSDGAIDLPRLREGGIHVPFFALWVPTYYKGSEAVTRTLDFRDATQRVLDRYPDQIELATSTL
jgi:membrane dipeptidase